MEVSNASIFLPRNFNFLHRLPARFEILVIARGAVSQQGQAFEVEIQSQRLVLHSKIELEVDRRYTLEKKSTLEFRIVEWDAVRDNEAELKNSEGYEKSSVRESARIDAQGVFASDPLANYVDTLALKIFEDAKVKVEKANNKYAFDLTSVSNVNGVFVPGNVGQFTLFLSGSALGEADSSALKKILLPLGVERVRFVAQNVLERIAAGAVDLTR